MIGSAALPVEAVLGASSDDRLESLRRRPLEEVAREFEAMLVAQMISAMRKTVPESELLPTSAERRVLDGVFDQEMAKALVARGDFGLAEQLTRQVRHLEDTAAASETGASAAGASASGVWQWPVEADLSSEFGTRQDPITGQERMHRGIDLAAPAGTLVRAVAGGEVVFSEEAGGGGLVVRVRHGDGRVSAYAHLSESLVSVGQRLEPGEPLARVGSSGRSTGPHLHFSVSRDGRAEDPLPLLQGDGVGRRA